MVDEEEQDIKRKKRQSMYKKKGLQIITDDVENVNVSRGQ